MKGFMTFMREQGVIGFAVGFILGGAISQVVGSLVTDIINPLISGLTSGTKDLSVTVGSATITYGAFLGSIINFIILALIVYVTVKVLRLDKLDKEKEEKK
jgi:large conductance mechanosensitive channel